MPESGLPQTQPEPEIIEGGSVERVTDLPFEERRHRAATARVLAYCLLGILALTITLQYGFTVWLILSGRDSGVAALDKLFNALLPILSGLVGGAVTYYFTKERS
jgi:nitrate reductase NapE component